MKTKPHYHCQVESVTFRGKELEEALENLIGWLRENQRPYDDSGVIEYSWIDDGTDGGCFSATMTTGYHAPITKESELKTQWARVDCHNEVIRK